MSLKTLASNHQGYSLKRTVSLPLLTFYGLGNILGAGIYVLIGKVVSHAGVFAPISFVLSALLAGLTAFSYAELSARFPLSAGEAVYVQKGLRVNALAPIVGILIMIAGIVSAATILRGAAGYLQVFINVPGVVALPMLVIVLGGIAAWGIAQSVLIAALITLVEIAGLLLIIWVGLPDLLSSPWLRVEKLPLPGFESWPGVMTGAFLAFYAFIGFEDMVNVAEEVRKPERNLPRAILLAFGISTLLYFAVALVAVSSVPSAVIGQSDAPLASLYQQITGKDPVVITLIASFAVINGALIQMIMVSRVAYGMARNKWLPQVFGRIYGPTRTPLVATVAVSFFVLLMALQVQTETLAKATSFSLLIVFALVNLALLRLKRESGPPAGIINVPIWLPAAGLVSSVAFILIQVAIDLSD